MSSRAWRTQGGGLVAALWVGRVVWAAEPPPVTSPAVTPQVAVPDLADAAIHAALDWEIRREVLDNGLLVQVQEDHRAPLIAVHLQYGVGAAQDPAGQTGLAHLMEHLMFEGSAHAPDGAFDLWLAQAGGDDNAWTSHDYTAFYEVVPSGALDLVLFLEADRMANLAQGIDADDVANQAAVVLGERSQAQAQRGGLDFAAISLALYPPGHPYRGGVMGSGDDLRRIELDDVIRAHDRLYGPSNATLSIVGDVDAGTALACARRWFGELPGGSPMASSPPPSLPQGERRAVFRDGARGVKLYAVWPTVPRGDPDEPALDLLAEVLASGPGSRMGGRRRWRSTDGVSGWTDNNRVAGMFVLELSAPRGRSARLRRVLDHALADLRRHPPTSVELDRRQARWRAWSLRAAEDLDQRAALINACAWMARTVSGSPPPQGACLAWDLDRHMAVTPEDLRRVAARWLTPEGRVLLSVVPDDGRRGRRRALKGSTVVEIP